VTHSNWVVFFFFCKVKTDHRSPCSLVNTRQGSSPGFLSFPLRGATQLLRPHLRVTLRPSPPLLRLRLPWQQVSPSPPALRKRQVSYWTLITFSKFFILVFPHCKHKSAQTKITQKAFCLGHSTFRQPCQRLQAFLNSAELPKHTGRSTGCCSELCAVQGWSPTNTDKPFPPSSQKAYGLALASSAIEQ